MIGPPTGGHDSDMENADDDVLKTAGLPDEVAGEIEVFNIRNDDIEGISDDGHNIVTPQPKKAKQTTKKAKVNVKWKKSHINSQTFSQYDQDKKAQAVLLENPELAALTMWTSFEKIFAPLIELILHETNQYAIRDKNKLQFKLTSEELTNFIGLIFLSEYNIRLSERDYWSIDQDVRCDAFCEAMSRNRFFEIKSFIHTADNQSLSESRMAKVEPLYDLLNKKIQQFELFTKTLALINQWCPTMAVIHVSNSYMQSQFVLDTNCEY